MNQKYEFVEIFNQACKSGDLDQLKSLINRKLLNVDDSLPEEKFRYSVLPVEYPLLVRAIENRSISVVKLLLDRGADVNIEIAKPLQRAILAGDANLVGLLLKHSKDLFMSIFATFYWDASGFECLIEQIELDGTSLRSVVQVLRTLSKYVNKLIGTSETILVIKYFYGLVEAILDDDQHLVKIILNDEIFDFCLRNHNFSILIMRLKRFDIATLFINKGINIGTILFESIKIGDVVMMELCLAHGLDKKTKKDFVYEAVFTACKYKQTKLLRILLSKYQLKLISYLKFFYLRMELKTFLKYSDYIDVNEVEHDMTLLDFAETCENFELLLKYGANPFNIEGAKHRCREDFCYVLNHFAKLRKIDEEYVDRVPLKIVKFGEEVICESNISTSDEELELLKVIRIGNQDSKNNKGTTLFDIFYFKPSKVLQYLKDLEVLAKEHNGDFEKKFQNFGFILNHQLRRGIRRRKLIERVRWLLEIALGSKITEVIAFSLLNHFCDKELERFGDFQWMISKAYKR